MVRVLVSTNERMHRGLWFFYSKRLKIEDSSRARPPRLSTGEYIDARV